MLNSIPSRGDTNNGRAISASRQVIGDGPVRRGVVNVRGVLLTATILTAPMAAMAQPVDGLYIGAAAGVNVMSDQTLNR